MLWLLDSRRFIWAEPQGSFSIDEEVALHKFIPHVPIGPCAFGLVGPFLTKSAVLGSCIEDIVPASCPWQDDVGGGVKEFADVFYFEPKAAPVDSVGKCS